MKIISIVSSGRKVGNTERAVNCIEEELRDIAIRRNVEIEFEKVYLSNSDIKFCRGCRVCFDKGEALCPLKDEVLSIRDKINQGDGLILASPVYVEDINGIMKNWIDRMAFNCHRPAFSGKAAIIITTSGAGATSHALNTMKSALHTWGFNICAKGNFRAGSFIEKAQLKTKYDNKIKVLADKLFKTISNAPPKGPSFNSLMVFKVQQKNWQMARDKWNTFDYAYWKNKGWLEKGCSYYIPHNSTYIKVKFAELVGNIISRFFI